LGGHLDLDAFLESAGVEILSEVGDGRASRKYMILCPWVGEHTTSPETGCFVGQYPDRRCFFHCWHSHCGERRFSDFWHEVLPAGGYRRKHKVFKSGKEVIRHAP
jgi:hypothetical protein